MIQCPDCGFANFAGSAFCAECGYTLIPAETQTVPGTDLGRSAGAPGPRWSSPGIAPPADNWATLHLLDSGQLLPLAARNEFTLGRAVEGQPVMPDIDLAPYQAFGRGVSRLHAIIKRGIDDIWIMDLESANGTFVNGRRLELNEECALSNGDVVALGALEIQILLKTT